MNKPQLTDKDLYCIARLLQGAIFEHLTFGCTYCKYSKDCYHTFTSEHHKIHLDVIRDKLENITGLDLKPVYDPSRPEQKFAHQ